MNAPDDGLPWLASALLRGALPDDARGKAVLGDLEELWRERRGDGRLRADLWITWQAVTVTWSYRRRERTGAMWSGTESWTTTLRRLAATPAFAAAVVATLALGVGANSAVFSIVRAVLVSPLPYPDADRIVFVHESPEGSDFPEGWASARNYLDWHDRTTSWESLALFRGRSVSVTTDVVPEYAYGAHVTSEFFDVFGVQPALGRRLAPSDVVEGAPPVVVIGHGLWSRGFGGDPGLIGGTVRVDGTPHTVVGIMPSGFEAHGDWVGLPVQVWRPFVFTQEALDQGRSYHVAGRLAEGVSLPVATAEMQALTDDLTRLRPEENRNWHVRLDTYQELMVGDVAPELWLLLSITGLILLIACANVANLCLNRVLDRRRELAARRALGATTASVIRLVLRESFVLALAGGVCGVAIAQGMVSLARSLEPGRIPRLDEVGIDTGVLLFSLLVVTLSALVIGITAAYFATRAAPAGLVRSARSGGPGGARIRDALVGLQLVLSFALLLGAGLLGRSFAGLRSASLGFDGEGVVAATVALSWSRVSDIDDRVHFTTEVLDGLRELPEVDAAGMINSLPLSGSNASLSVDIEGVTEEGRSIQAASRGISPGYLETMGIALESGRGFERADVDDPSVVLVNRTFADRFVVGEAVGLRVRPVGEDRWRTVVGVVGDVRHYGPAQAPRPEVYAPYSDEYLTSKTFVVRWSGPLAEASTRLREVITSVDPDQPVREVRSMDRWVTDATASARFLAAAGLLAAVLATALAAVGLFGVLSANVRARSRELAVRIALGAPRRSVMRLVVVRAAALLVSGLVGGALVAGLVGGTLQSVLVGVDVADPLVALGASATFVVVAVLAALGPARRATSLDPATVLQEG